MGVQKVPEKTVGAKASVECNHDNPVVTNTHCNTEEFSDNHQNISWERGELGAKRLQQMHVKGKMSEIILPKGHKKP